GRNIFITSICSRKMRSRNKSRSKSPNIISRQASTTRFGAQLAHHSNIPCHGTEFQLVGAVRCNIDAGSLCGGCSVRGAVAIARLLAVVTRHTIVLGTIAEMGIGDTRFGEIHAYWCDGSHCFND
ncbi:hypothetical protein PMAYCL1PPCAC_17268, partial [Pristionchus mayeri]